MYDWAKARDDEAYAHEVLESISPVEAFPDRLWVLVDHVGTYTLDGCSGAMMFCNHGCNGTYNLGRATGFTEANVDIRDRDKGASRIIYPRARSIQASD